MKLFLLTLLLANFSYSKTENLSKAVHFFFEAEYSLLNNQMLVAGRNYDRAAYYSKSLSINESAADFFFSIGDYKKSVKFYSELNMLDPSNFVYIKGLYNSLMALEKYREAENLLNSSTLYSIDRLNYLLADFHYTLENWDELLDSYTEILLEYPNERSILKEMFLIASISQNTNKLIKSIERIWIRYKDAYFLEALIRLSYELGNYRKTLKYLNQFPKYNLNKDFIIIKSQSLIEAGQPEKSIIVLKGYTGLPDQKIYSIFVKAYDLINDLFNHQLYCKKLINEFPDFELGFREMILYYVKTNKYTKALSLVAKAKKKFKKNPVFDYMEAEIYFFKNKYNLALDGFIKSNRAGLEDIDLQIKIGYCYEKLGQTLLSDSLFLNLIEKHPNNASLLNNYAYTITERESLDVLDLRYALSISRKANIIEPDNAAFLDTLGWIYFKLKYFNNALSALKKSIKYDNLNPVIWEHLADVYIKVGKNDKALECYKKALNFDRENLYLLDKISKYE